MRLIDIKVYGGTNMSNQDNYLKKELYERFSKDRKIFEFLQESTLDGIWYWDLEQPEHEWMSAKFWTTLGYNPKHKQHKSSEWQTLIHKDDLKEAEQNLKRHIDDPEYKYDQIVRYKHKNGSTVYVRCRGYAIRDEQGKAIRMLGAHNNITPLMQSHVQMVNLKKEYETVFNGSQDALFLIDVHGHKEFTFVRNNYSHQIKTGIKDTMIQGQTPYTLLGESEGEVVAQRYQKCVDSKEVTQYEETLELPAGRRVWSTTLTPIIEDNEVKHIVGSAIDITNQKALEKELEYRANHDDLTKLANRAYLQKKLSVMTSNLNHFTFFFIDLNDFKYINDNYGHIIGDEVLKEVAKRILSVCDVHDFVARLGGDEFVILKTNFNASMDASSFKDYLNEQLKKPLKLREIVLNIDCAIGYAYYPLSGLTYDELIKEADQRMYKHKTKIKNNTV